MSGIGSMAGTPRTLQRHRRLSGLGLAALMAASSVLATGSPAHASAIVVTTTGDPALSATSCPATANPCSLRAAVAQANAAGGTNTITFGVNGIFKVTAASGGAIHVSANQNLTITGKGAAKTVIDGQNEDHRILANDNGATLFVSGVTIRNAHPLHGVYESGAALFSTGTLTVSASVISGNTLEGTGTEVSFGGAGITALGPLTVLDSTISGNALKVGNSRANGSASGAGIFVVALSANIPVVVRRSVIRGNSMTVVGAGGGGFAGIGGGMTVEGSTAVNNTVIVDLSTLSGNTIVDHSTGGTFAVAGGGLVSDASGGASILNSTIDGNAVRSDLGRALGGGIVIGNGGATVTNATISGNVAASGSSVFSEFSPVRIRSTILSSLSPSGCATDLGGTVTSLGDNLDSGTSCGLNMATDLHGVDPKLGPLRGNGGPTPTRALLPGSPAIDAVAATDCPPPAVDQRGVARPQGPRCDIGAFELRVADDTDGDSHDQHEGRGTEWAARAARWS